MQPSLVCWQWHCYRFHVPLRHEEAEGEGGVIGPDHRAKRLTPTLVEEVVVVAAAVEAALVGGKPMANVLPGGTDETRYGPGSRVDAEA